jgi:uncharacterized spore protein YtfJ
MERKKLTVGNPVEIGGMTIIPLMCISASCNRLNGKLTFYGSIHPQYIVLVNSDGTRALTINGEGVSLEELVQEVPKLSAVLDSIE